MGLTFQVMESPVGIPGNFDWSYTEEPHATRRIEILKKHPEIKKCFGIDPSFKYVVVAMVVTQFVLAWLLKDSDWLLVLIQAYCVSGTFNHALTLAVHEISHNMAFGCSKPLANRLFGFIANAPMLVPMSVSFKKYHDEHHRFLGENVLDTDIPTELENRIFKGRLGKLIWLFLQPFFYALRPFVTYKKAVTDFEIINAVFQLLVDYVVFVHFGPKSVVFLLGGFFIGSGIHPLAAHYISDHYTFQTGQETYSYYGPINLVTFNVGHHIEHHDFPFVCGANLPQIRKLAPEYYNDWLCHESWVYLLYDFVVNPNITLYSRVKRKTAEPSDIRFFDISSYSTYYFHRIILLLFDTLFERNKCRED